MTQQTINVGAAPNDGTGDPARTAFTKSNDNFTELYAAVTAANQVFYCDQTDAADVATYKRLLLTPSTHAETSVPVSCTGTGDVLVGAFITDPGVPGAIDFPAGSAYRRLYGSVSAGVARFHLQVYTRTTGGVETLARDEFSNSFSNLTATLQEWLATPASGGALSATDRLVVKIYAQRVSGPTTVTVTFYAEGSAHASQIQTTITTGSSAPISVSPPLTLSGGNLTIDLSAYQTAPHGRLTLQTGTPVMTTTQAAKTTIFYTPYTGNLVGLYNGTSFVMTPFTELSQTTTDTTKSPAAVAANTNYDLFVWSDGGTVRCTRGPAWSNSTAGASARGTGAGTTELVMVAGALLNAVAITNGPAAQRGTYVGTVRSNASSQIDFILGGIAAGGTAGKVGVWNTYNRRCFSAFVGTSTDSWTYATAAFRFSDGATASNMYVDIVHGLAEDSINATFAGAGVTSSDIARIGIGLNSSTTKVPSSTTGAIPANIGLWAIAKYGAVLPLGYNQITALELGGAGVTFYGDFGFPMVNQSGLVVSGWY